LAEVESEIVGSTRLIAGPVTSVDTFEALITSEFGAAELVAVTVATR
jgi:hypothetical protein